MPASPDHDAAPRRCITCAYVLEGLPSPGQCPECGREYDLADRRTYTLKPPFIRWKFWLPGLILSVAYAVVASGFIAIVQGGWGWSLWIAVPLAASAILGYGTRVGTLAKIVLGLAFGGSLLLGLASMSLAGFFCGLMLAGVLLLPISLGVGSGVLLRTILKSSRFGQRGYLPIILLALLPLLAAALEGPAAPHAPVTIKTTRTLDAPASECWEAIVFYEEVTHEPPLLLRIGLAHPLRTLGRSRAPGDIKVCIYNKGRITKRITEASPARRLAFDVVDQDIGYERDVRLLGGAFEFEPLGPARTRVTLTTTYVPYLAPRFAWLPGERLAVSLLHNHVLDGMAQRLDADAPALAAHAR